MKLQRLDFLAALLCLPLSGLLQCSANAEDRGKPELYKPAPEVIAKFQEGRKKFESNDFSAGEQAMTEVIKMDPKFAGPYYVRACCRHLQNNYTGALSDCNTSITMEPNGNPIVYFERAVAEYRLDQLDPCIKDCDMALKLAPTFPGSYIYRAHAKANKGDREGALRDCETYLKAKPTDPKALMFKERLLSGG